MRNGKNRKKQWKENLKRKKNEIKNYKGWKEMRDIRGK